MNDSLGDCGFYCAGAAVSCRPPRPAFAAGWLQWRRECELQQAGCSRHRECKSRWPVMDGERRGFDAVGADFVPFDGAERAVRHGHIRDDLRLRAAEGTRIAAGRVCTVRGGKLNAVGVDSVRFGGAMHFVRRGCIRGGLRLRAAEGTRITASELRSSALSARGQFGRRGEKRRAVPEGGRVI